MKKEHIVDKLLNVAVILVMLGTSIIMYNTIIDLVTDEPYLYEYGCIDYETEPTEEQIEADKEINCLENEDYVTEAKDDYYKNVISDLLSEIYVLALSVGLLFLLNKKDLTKEGIVTKILNAILIMLTFGGTIGIGAYIINQIFFTIDWENVLRSFGLILFPIIFYYVLNKYIFIEGTQKSKKKKIIKKKTK